jgi:cyclase
MKPAAQKSNWAIVLCVCIAGANCSQRAAESPFTLRQIGPGAWAAIDNPESASPAAANAGFVIGDAGVTVIDTFWSVDAARQLLAEIQRRTPLPIRFVVNTHYHLDHVAGNAVFAAAGAVVVGHRNVRDWIHTENLRLLGAYLTPELKEATEASVAPTAVYDEGVNLYPGVARVQVLSFPGHTGGDSIVLIPDSKVAFLGDLFWRNMLPNLIDASTQPWIDSLGAILAANGVGFTFVPGHGDVGDARDVAAFRDYLITLRLLVAEAKAAGESGDALVETTVPKLKDKYGQWEFAEPLAKDNVLQTEAELSGTKRIPMSARP